MAHLYTPSVYPIVLRVFLVYTIVAAIVAIRFAYVAATASDSRRKGKALLITSLLFSSWLCLNPLLSFLYDGSLPVFEFQGKISAVDVRNSSDKYYSAYVRIHTISGGDVDIHSSDRSVFLRPSEQVKVRYRGDTGELVKAYFYSPDGRQEGVLQNSSNWGRIWLSLLGLFCIWASIRKFRRDPEGAETKPDEEAPVSIINHR